MRIAICICTYRRPALLDRVLTRLAELAPVAPPPVTLQAVVVDNAAEADARTVCEVHRTQLPFALHYAQESTRGISHARNRAVREAMERDADFVAFLDDDDLPERDWLAQLVAAQRESGASLVFGYWRLPAGAVLADWMVDIPFLRPPPFEGRSPYGFPTWAGTGNILIGRDVLEAVQADGHVFEPDDALLGGEDVDFFIRAMRRGFRTAQTATSLIARGWEPERLTVGGLLRRAYLGGVIRVTIDRRHLPVDEYRRIRSRRVARSFSLFKSLLKSPYWCLSGRRASAMRAAVDVARWLGEISAAWGLRYRYY